MGTYDGLNRYDGREFRVFRNRLNDTASLPHNYIYALHEDRSGNLWVGTGQGVVRYDPVRAAFVPLLIQPNYASAPGRIPVSANAIQSDDQDNLFVATIGWGLLRTPADNLVIMSNPSAALAAGYGYLSRILAFASLTSDLDGCGLSIGTGDLPMSYYPMEMGASGWEQMKGCIFIRHPPMGGRGIMATVN
jgi:ligand-binding sensor domain-containing protein